MNPSAFLHFCISACLLTACGFEPVYGQKDTPQTLVAGVTIAPMKGREGQLFRIALEDRLNPPGGVARPAYRLNASLSVSEAPIGVARDNTVSRYNMYLTSHYTLHRTQDDTLVASGDLTYVNSYNNLTNAYFSTYIAQGDALKRGIDELSELYRQRLAAYLSVSSDDAAALKPIDPVTDTEREKAIKLPVFQ